MKPDELIERLNKGEFLCDSLKVDLNEHYKNAYLLYTHKDYKNALSAFLALAQLNPLLPDAWIGAGSCLQAQNDYESAIAAYDLAMRLNENLTNALFYSGQCAYQMGDKPLAKEFFIKASQKEGPFASKARLILEEKLT